MSDSQLRDAAIAELKKTTVGWNKVAGYSPDKLATTHWGKALAYLQKISSTSAPAANPRLKGFDLVVNVVGEVGAAGQVDAFIQ